MPEGIGSVTVSGAAYGITDRVLWCHHRIDIVQQGFENAVFEAGTHEEVEEYTGNVCSETSKQTADNR